MITEKCPRCGRDVYGHKAKLGYVCAVCTTTLKSIVNRMVTTNNVWPFYKMHRKNNGRY